MIVMILPVLCVLSVNDTKAENVKADVGSGDFVPVTLYFHSEEAESELDTNPPTNNTTATEDFGTKENPNTVTFRTDSLDKDLYVNTTQCFRVAFNFTVDVTPYPSGPYDWVTVNLTITVLEDSIECASKKYPGVPVQGTKNRTFEIPGDWDDEPLTFDDDWDYNFDENHEIKVKITPEITEERGLDDKIAYKVYMEYDNEAKLGVLSNVHCAPVEIELDTYDKNNNLKDEFMPNLDAEECIIRFRGGIEDAFGDEDITYVGIEINGVTSSENITANKEKELLYEWDYSGYSESFVADTPYTATITVETVQHTFTQTTSFNFSAYGLEAKIDDDPSKASETILAGSQADYTISMRNTGASKADVRVTLTIFVVTPGGLHEWNISLDGKSKEVNTTTATSVNPANLSYPDFELSGGSPKSLTLTAESLGPEDVGENWYCMVDVKVEFVGHSEIEPETLSATTYLAPPYKISLDWTETPDDLYYALVDVSSTLYVKVTNMGTMPDTVNLSLNYTNHDMWDITLEPQVVNLSSFHQTGYYNSGIKLTVKPSSVAGEGTAFVNITAYSKGFGSYNESLTRKYLTLNLSRAFGITMDVELKGTGEVDVKDFDGEAIYEVVIK
ncbi:MAG: hypothetical protein L6265_05600, partial [Thermoplasmatales archaeon]|nr:hypothetical protein [Thermoplasmatales archaeon]